MAAQESSTNVARGDFGITGIDTDEEEESSLVRKHLTLV